MIRLSGLRYTPWAGRMGISPVTVEGWLNQGHAPYPKTMRKLVAGTGIPEEWWLHGDLPPPKAVKAQPAPAAQGAEPPPADYVAIPLYDDARASADDALMFRDSWIRAELGMRPQDLCLIRVSGDSMEPTFRPGDSILVDRRATRPDREGVYILCMNGMLLIRRLQALPGAKVRVISDNPAFDSFEVALSALGGEELAVIGRVVWIGRRI